MVKADDGQGVNHIAEQSFTLIVEDDVNNDPIAIRLNAGGYEYTAVDGRVFNEDNGEYAVGTSSTFTRGGGVAHTEDDYLYVSERNGENFGYSIDVPNGNYDVILHFAEIYWRSQDRRIFTVEMEGKNIGLNNFDMLKEKKRYKAIVKRFEAIKVEDGKIDINFTAIKDIAKVSALEIVTSGFVDGRKSVRINCGGDRDLIFGGHTFISDAFFAGKSMTYTNPNIDDVRMTTYDELYKSERVSSEDLAPFSYNIPVGDGEYIVFVHFAEIYFGATGGGPGGEGRRVFSMKMEGEDELVDFDIIKEIGSMGAVVKEFPVSVIDGELNLDFSATKNRAKISAIEVLRPEDAEFALSRTSQGGNSFVGVDVDQDDEEEVDVISLAPNPTSGNTRLIMENSWTGGFKVRIFDAQGRLVRVEVKNKDFDSFKSLIEVSDLYPGLYTLQVIRQDYNRSLKLWIH